MQRIKPDHAYLQYCGRIDKNIETGYCFVFPYSSVSFRVKTSSISLLVHNIHSYWDHSLGYIIDGKQGKVDFTVQEGEQLLVVADDLKEEIHDVTIFKRQDGCHYFYLKEIQLPDDAVLYEPAPVLDRRIEIYGDSVSAGEVSEAVDYVGKEDPEHNGEYSNSWYSYGAIAARKLNAQLHDIAQGGIALLPGTGWYSEPEYIGMEQVYDKIQYNPKMTEVKTWDFSQYTPQIVIVAIGQNDSHPVDIMKEDDKGEKAQNWKKHYRQFIEKLRMIYPKSHIILATTILQHDARWDQAIDEICRELHDSRITHFLYSQNGTGTPGHVRISEAEQMGEELADYITSLGESVWN